MGISIITRSRKRVRHSVGAVERLLERARPLIACLLKKRLARLKRVHRRFRGSARKVSPSPSERLRLRLNERKILEFGKDKVGSEGQAVSEGVVEGRSIAQTAYAAHEPIALDRTLGVTA